MIQQVGVAQGQVGRGGRFSGVCVGVGSDSSVGCGGPHRGQFLGHWPQLRGGYKRHLQLAAAGDAFLDVSDLGKGLIWVNGRLLGRFWNIGPQQTLYVPAPWLKVGKNEVVAFELLRAKDVPPLERNSPWPKHAKGAGTVKLRGRMKPILDGPTPAYADDPEHKKKPAADAEFGPNLDVPGKPKE